MNWTCWGFMSWTNDKIVCIFSQKFMHTHTHRDMMIIICIFFVFVENAKPKLLWFPFYNIVNIHTNILSYLFVQQENACMMLYSRVSKKKHCAPLLVYLRIHNIFVKKKKRDTDTCRERQRAKKVGINFQKYSYLHYKM